MITTKWPRLIVVGEPVTPEQADEILIRTNNWGWLWTNDREWEATIERIAAEAAGRPVEALTGADGSEERMASIRSYHKALRHWNARMGVLSLSYLENSRIVSAWIGGPHGWCDWDGRIGCDNYNLGKWPEDTEISEDWTTIAAAFPFLAFTAQCVDDEGEGAVAAEWHVHDGQVDYNPHPTVPLGTPAAFDAEAVVQQLAFLHSGRERGCTEERLRSALERVASRTP